MGFVRDALLTRISLVACAALASLALAGCSKSGDDSDDSSDSSNSKATASFDVGSDARGACYGLALQASYLYSRGSFLRIAADEGLTYVDARQALDTWPQFAFGAAGAQIVACRAL